MYNLTSEKDSQSNKSDKNQELSKGKQIDTLEDVEKGVAPTKAKAKRAIVTTELQLPDLTQKHLDQTLTESILASTIKAARPLSNPSDLEGTDGKVHQKTSPLSNGLGEHR